MFRRLISHQIAKADSSTPPLDLRRPGNWLSFKGRINRSSFWGYYLLILMIIFTVAWMLEMVRTAMPGIIGVVAPTVMSLTMLTAMIAISSAMVRRLRDSGFHWWPVLALGLSCIALFTGGLYDLYLFEMARLEGAERDFLQNRKPLTEVLAVPFVIFAAWVFFGLSRRSKPFPQEES